MIRFPNVTTLRLLSLWVVMDSNHRRRKPADLQSAPFGHSGNHPNSFAKLRIFSESAKFSVENGIKNNGITE